MFHLKQKTRVIDENLERWATSSAKNIFSKHPNENFTQTILPKLQFPNHISSSYYDKSSNNDNHPIKNDALPTCSYDDREEKQPYYNNPIMLFNNQVIDNISKFK